VPDHQETRRKLIHMLGGLGPPVAVVLFGWSGSVSILLFLLTYIVLGGALNLRGIRLPVIASLIENTQRHTERFPVTAVEFLSAVLVIGLLAPAAWFFPAIGVLAFGDGLAGLIGTHYGRHKLPWNPRKSWEGLGAGSVGGAAGVVLLAYVGDRVDRAGFYAEPLLGAHWLAPSLFIVLAFALIVSGHAYMTKRAAYDLDRQAPRRFTLGAALTGLLLAAIPLVLVAVGTLENGPVLGSSQAGAFSLGVATYGVAAAGITMVLETALRRHDNLTLPAAFLVVFLPLVSVDPFAFGAA
jgi:dolichol kinase